MRIAMDVGGTTARIRVLSEDGWVCYDGEGPGGTLAGVGEEELARRFSALLIQAFTAADTTARQCTYLVVGASGMDSEEQRKTYKKIFRALGIPVKAIHIMNDGELLLAMFDRPAIVLISGTGSIALGTDGWDRQFRCGGWEHLLSDEGSATWIGMQLLRAFVQDADGQTEAPGIRSLLTGSLGLREPMDAVSFAAAHIMEKADIARLAPLAEQAMEAGDREAERILTEAADRLFALTETVASQVSQDGGFDLLLWGSVLHRNAYVRTRLSGRVHAAWPYVRVLLPESTALDCAALLAMERRGLKFQII